MKKKILHEFGDKAGKTFGSLIGGGINLVGDVTKINYFKEIGDSVSNTSHYTGKTVGRLGQGVFDTAKGLVTRNLDDAIDGIQEVGATTIDATKTVGKGFVYTVKSGADVAVGLSNKDYERAKGGAKNLGKVAAVGTIAIGIGDLVTGVGGDGESANANDVENIQTINEQYAGTTHPVSEVFYDTSIVELPDGSMIEGVFPVFDSAFDAHIPDPFYYSSDYTHIQIANEQLQTEVEQDIWVKVQFDDIQLQQIADGETPDGYTWHHHEQMGRMQLVETEPHDLSGHTGGRSLWGGGSENR